MGIDGESGFVPDDVAVPKVEEETVEQETLYEKVRKLLSEKPEDLAAFDSAYAETLDNLTRTVGEEKALDEVKEFLEKTYVELAGSDALLAYKEEQRKNLGNIEQKYTSGW